MTGELTECVFAEIGIEVPEGLANILLGAIHPEVERPSSSRSEVSIRSVGRHLIFRIKSSDVSALRAALNSYLRWANSVLDVLRRVR